MDELWLRETMPVEHDKDFYQWIRQQAAAVRAGVWDRVDAPHLAEEIEDLGNRVKQAVERQLVRVMVHLLKLKYREEEDAQACRRWRISVLDGRHEIAQALADTSSRRDDPARQLHAASRHARRKALMQTGWPVEAFPEVCPWTIAWVLDEDFYPNTGEGKEPYGMAYDRAHRHARHEADGAARRVRAEAARQVPHTARHGDGPVRCIADGDPPGPPPDAGRPPGRTVTGDTRLKRAWRRVSPAPLASIPVTEMAGSADLLRRHRTPVEGVGHTRAFMAVWATTPHRSVFGVSAQTPPHLPACTCPLVCMAAMFLGDPCSENINDGLGNRTWTIRHRGAMPASEPRRPSPTAAGRAAPAAALPELAAPA